MKKISIFALALTAFASCIKDTTTTTDNNSDKNINFSLKFDPTQARLGNAGQPVSVPAGNAAQNPAFKTMAVHFIELCPDSTSALSTSSVNLPNKSILLYKGVETSAGGSTAIDFDQLKKAAAGEKFFAAPIKGIKAGTYKFIRVSVAYQNYDITYNLNNISYTYNGITFNSPNQTNKTARVASFLGFNSYIRKATINAKDTTINGNRPQGFGLSESVFAITTPITYSRTILGGWQSEGTTTVVNPVAASLVGLPLNSCLIQGKLAKPLVITGNETADINAILSFSTNKSFEWRDTNGNGKLDFDATTPANSEKVMDMGLRGLVATWQ
jgi:hypothetical protein